VGGNFWNHDKNDKRSKDNDSIDQRPKTANQCTGKQMLSGRHRQGKSQVSFITKQTLIEPDRDKQLCTGTDAHKRKQVERD